MKRPLEIKNVWKVVKICLFNSESKSGEPKRSNLIRYLLSKPGSSDGWHNGANVSLRSVSSLRRDVIYKGHSNA